jgi:sensor c-di-GMP phosphodiesterase-like protein
MPSFWSSLGLLGVGIASGAALAWAHGNHGPSAISRQIRAGLRRREFRLEYQPIVDLVSGTCSGAEALLRWQTARGTINPDVFMPAALQSNLAEPLTYRVIELVATEMPPLLRARPQFYVGINVPPQLLGRGGLAVVAESCGLLRYMSQIVIELTETAIVDDASREAVSHARAMRARVAIDDFGTGMNELAQLQELEIDFIKIDRSFVRRIGIHAQATRFLEWIIELTHALGATAIAEGVETPAQADALRALGVEKGQGFLFSQPLPVTALRSYLGGRPTRAGRTGWMRGTAV